MVRALCGELSRIAALALFISTVLLWAAILGAIM